MEHDGFRLLIDPGYAIVPRLLERIDATDVDAVLVSHGHPDHCADLHPLLRARVLREEPAPALPVHTLPGAVDRILDLDEPGTLQDAFTLVEFAAGDQFDVGPFQVQTWQLPHWVPNVGIRLAADGQVLAYDELVLKTVVFPSAADVIWQANYLCFLVAVFSLPQQPQSAAVRGASRTRTRTVPRRCSSRW